jgi:hypothetical protein
VIRSDLETKRAACLDGVTWLDLDLEPFLGGYPWIKHDTLVQVMKKATSCSLCNMMYTITTTIPLAEAVHSVTKVAPFSNG